MSVKPDAHLIQRQALFDAVCAQMHGDEATHGLPFGPVINVGPLGSNGAVAFLLGEEADTWQNNIEILADAWNPERPSIARQTTVDWAIEMAQLALRRSMGAASFEDTPSWAVLVHPVMAALAIGHEPDRTLLPSSRFSGMRPNNPARWTTDARGEIEHDGGLFGGVAIGKIRAVEGAIPFQGDDRLNVLLPMGGDILSTMIRTLALPADRRAIGITIPVRLPEKLMAACVGRRLGDVVRLPETGHPEVDAAAAETIVAKIEELTNGINLFFTPTRFIPYGVPPDEESRRIMGLAPVVL